MKNLLNDAIGEKYRREQEIYGFFCVNPESMTAEIEKYDEQRK